MSRGVAIVVALCAALASACGGSAPEPRSNVPADARDVKVSLFDVDCADCANEVVVELRKDGPVYASSFDKKRVVLDVKVPPSITAERVVQAAKRAGFRAEIGDAGGAYAKQAEAPAGADVSTVVTDGRDVPDLSSILVAHKITVVDFYADWCGPCRDVDAHVKSLIGNRSDLAYRRLNVVDWDSPLAKHYIAKVPALPYVLVFDGNGGRVDAIAGLDLGRLDAALSKAKP